jgi:hypothetical protein
MAFTSGRGKPDSGQDPEIRPPFLMPHHPAELEQRHQTEPSNEDRLASTIWVRSAHPAELEKRNPVDLDAAHSIGARPGTGQHNIAQIEQRHTSFIGVRPAPSKRFKYALSNGVRLMPSTRASKTFNEVKTASPSRFKYSAM